MKVFYKPNPRTFRGQVHLIGKLLFECACNKSCTSDKIEELATNLQYFAEKERHRIAHKRLN